MTLALEAALTDVYDWDQRRSRRHLAPITEPTTSGGGSTAYGQAALTNEVNELLQTTEGARNDRLNRAAFSLAQLAAAGHLPQQQVTDQLRAAALHIGLTPAEVDATLRSGHRAGAAQPRDVQPLQASVIETFVPALAPTGEAGQAGTPRDRTSWWPQPIADRAAAAAEEPAPTHLVRDDGRALLYSGKVNGLIGESESGKSWVALLAVTQAARGGQPVLILDFEDSAASVHRRLRSLDVDDQAAQLIAYADPSESLGALQSQDLAEALIDPPAVIVVDGVNAAMTLLGYDLNSNTDATLFTTKFLRPLARTGACVITVDHVPKNPDARGKGGIGAQAKRAMTDGCTLLVEVAEPFGIGQSGRLKLTVDKDRPGAVRGISSGGRHAGKVQIDSIADQVRIHIIGPDLRPAEERERWRPTGLMERVSRLLEASAGPLPFRAIKDAITGRDTHIRAAIEALVEDGNVTLSTGPRGASLHYLAAKYRENQDNDTKSSVSRLCPDRNLSQDEAATEDVVESTENPPCPVCPTVSRPCPGHGQASVSHPIPPYGDGTHSAAPSATQPCPDQPETLDLPADQSSCNHCGEPTDDTELDRHDGYCRRCAWLVGR